MILIIGKVPPPYGGVTIHVSRLLKKLSKTSLELSFLKLSFINLFKSIIYVKKNKIIHVIVSHPVVRFYFSILGLILKKTIIITYTDNLNEFPSPFYNYLNLLSLKKVKYPLVLNKNSFEIAKKQNVNSKLISAFIPPEIDDSNLENLKKELKFPDNDFNHVFCTNAFTYDLDKFNNEVYGILPLVKIFNNLQSKCLIICDPSGNYKDFFKNNKIILNNNIKLLSKLNFSFIDVIKLSDCLIRATTTDGDSLSIHEAFFLKKDVIASDCVDRPLNCVLYKKNDFSELNMKILGYKKNYKSNFDMNKNNGYDQIFDLYKKII